MFYQLFLKSVPFVVYSVFLNMNVNMPDFGVILKVSRNNLLTYSRCFISFFKFANLLSFQDTVWL